MLWSWASAPALALLLLAGAAAFTVDCDKDYADCDSELSKLTEEDELATSAPIQPTTKAKPSQPEIRPAREFTPVTENSAEGTEIPELLFTSDTAKPKLNNTNVPKGRLLNVSMDELQSFANAIHNRTKEQPKKKEPVMTDLSDVSLDSDDDFDLMPHHFKQGEDSRILHKALQDNEHDSNEPRLGGSSESETCAEHGIGYKTGEKMDRGCDESCECTVLGSWQCTPRCQQPYIRRGRRLADPLCFETPVDNCCSIIACASNNHDTVETKTTASTPNDTCRYGTTNYTNGQDWDVGCEQRCSCGSNGVVTCKPRCNALSPSEHCINVQDPHDVCCQVQVCDVTHDAHEHREPLLPTPATTMQDRMDSFINDLVVSTTILPTSVPELSASPMITFTVLTNNSVKVNLGPAMAHLGPPFHFQLSNDKGNTFQDVLLNNTRLDNLEQGLEYILKVNKNEKTYEFMIPQTNVSANDLQTTNGVSSLNKTAREGCTSEGVFYSVGDEFRIGCSELCECVGPDEKECAALECPSHVGLELMSPTCIRWAPDPPDWVPQPPACCPSKMRCLSDGSCDYRGNKIPNWSEVPVSLTGCELRCFCETGTLDCQNICSPLPPLPPQTLRCQPGFKPAPVNISDDDCCKQWGCIPIASGPSNQAPGKQLPVLPPFIPTIPPDAIHFPTEDDLGELGQNNDIHRQQQPPKGPPKGAPPFAIPAQIPPGVVEQQDNMKLNLVSLVADSPTSVKMLFELSPVLVGLRGSVDLRYTDKDDDDVSHWYSQVFAPADEVLTTARLEFRLSGLRPSTVYKLRGKLYLHNLPLEPVSAVYTVRTMDAPQVMEEKRRAVQTGVRVHQVNATAAQLSWRHFSEDELQYIDGIQVRYRPLEQPIYSMTELLHHSRVSADLLDLRPGSRYEASLVLVPPPRSPVELFDPVTLNFTTPVFYDMYNWSVTVEAEKIGADSAEVTWHGVPAPPERYVRVYRAAHSCDGEMTPAQHRENDAFKLADRDQPPTLVLSGLRANTKCRVWLELFLTNGKVKISNVLDITTSVEDSENEIDNEVLASSVAGSRSGSGVHGDYYSALVVVGVVAALGTLTSLLLLLVVMRRHRPHSISITTVPSAPREPTLPPYDNPAYKLELQQETMDL